MKRFCYSKMIYLEQMHFFDAATCSHHLRDNSCAPQRPASKDEHFTGERDDVIQEVARGAQEFGRRRWTGARENTVTEFVEANLRILGEKCAPMVSNSRDGVCVHVLVRTECHVWLPIASFSFFLSSSCGAVTDLRPAWITTWFHF